MVQTCCGVGRGGVSGYAQAPGELQGISKERKKKGGGWEMVVELSLSKIRQQLPRLFRTTG